MKQIELRKNLTDSLSGLYAMKAIARLAEFWQGEQRVLFHIYQHDPCGINPSALSDELHVSRARITTALSALRNKGYITMEMCEDDRRRMQIILTDDGRHFIDSKQKEVDSHFDELISGLGESNTLAFIRLANRSIEIMSERAIKSNTPVRPMKG